MARHALVAGLLALLTSCIGSSDSGASQSISLTATTLSSTQVQLQWQYSGSPWGYSVYRDGQFVSTAFSTSKTIGGLTPGHTYCFQVKATQILVGVEAVSNTACASTPADAPPSRPSSLTATAVSNSAIELAWSESTDDHGSVTYNIYRDGIYLANTGDLEYRDGGLGLGETHCYVVRARDSILQQSDPGPEACATTSTDTIRPEPPTEFGARVVSYPGGRDILLEWNDAQDDGIVVSYVVHVPGAGFIEVNGATQFLHTGLNPDQEYCYRVRAVDAGGNTSEFSHTACASTAWTSEVVDGPYLDPRAVALVLDAAGDAHIAYHDFVPFPPPSTEGFEDVLYSTNTSGAWQTTTAVAVDLPGTATPVQTALAIDGAAGLHLSHQQGPAVLGYAQGPGMPWVDEVVDPSLNAGSWSSIAVDSSFQVHVSYASGSTLWYAILSGGFWTIEEVDPDANVSQGTSILVDPDGHVHIAYCSLDPLPFGPDLRYDLRYATNASGIWEVRPMFESQANLGLYPSLARSADGDLRVSHYYESLEELWLTNISESGSWSQQIDLNQGPHSSLAIDATGVMHVSYVDDEQGDLKYAKRAPDNCCWWTVTTIESLGRIEGPASLALDSSGRPHIAYCVDGEVRIARRH